MVLEGRSQGHTDALVVGEAIRKGWLFVVDVADGELPHELDSLPLDKGEKQAIHLASRTFAIYCHHSTMTRPQVPLRFHDTVLDRS